jgi:hypothetical protein
MSSLSEVSLVIAQRAGDLEKAREIFTAETRAFVTGILGAVRRARSDAWATARVRLDLPREIETEAKSTGYLSGQFAIGRPQVRFKKGTNFQVVADVRFGVEFDEASERFVWQMVLVPAARYQRIDDLLWRDWKNHKDGPLPGAEHNEKSNTVRFVMRELNAELTAEVAFSDTKRVLEFVVQADAALADAIGVEGSSIEEAPT